MENKLFNIEKINDCYDNEIYWEYYNNYDNFICHNIKFNIKLRYIITGNYGIRLEKKYYE